MEQRHREDEALKALPLRTQGVLEDGGVWWQDELLFGQGDAHLKVRISTLLEHLVTLAGQHYRHFGMSYQRFLDTDTAFVLTRTTFTITRLPDCFELLTIQSWIDGIRGPYYQRVTQWLDEEGNVVIRSRSDWVMIQPSTRQVCKPDKEDSRFIQKSPVILPPCQRIKCGEETIARLTLLGQHKVVWSEIDANGHFHSSRYGDMIWDVLPQCQRERTLTQLSVEFHKECKEHDVIVLEGTTQEEQAYVIQGLCEGQVCFKARLTF